MVTKDLFSFAAVAAKALCLVAAAATALSLASCSDDDDDDGGGASGTETEAGAITDSDGNKIYLTSADWMRFDYDSNWQLTGWGDDDYYYFNVSYNPLRMEGTYLEDYGEGTTVFSNFSINSSGYITKVSYSANESFSDESYSSTATYNFTYNSSGQLTKIVCSGSGTETWDGETYSYSGKLTTDFTWSDGVITKISEESSEDDYSESTDITFDYGDNQYANTAKQYTNSVIEYLLGDYEALAFLGYLGIGPTYLPVSATFAYEYDEDGYTDSGTYTEKYSYGFNDNGTINWENWNGDKVYYTYSDGSSSSASNVRAATTVGSESMSKVRSHRGRNFLRRASQRIKTTMAVAE